MGYKRRPIAPRDGSWTKPAEHRSRPPSRQAVVRALRAVSNGGQRSVRKENLDADIFAATLHYFGTLAAARRALAIPQPAWSPAWSRDEVVRALRALHRKGVRMTKRGLIEAQRQDLIGAIGLTFESLADARQAAGIPPPKRTSERLYEWSPDAVLREIAARIRNRRSLAMSAAPPRLVDAGARFYGSWEAAVTAAGLDYDDVRLTNRPYTPERVVRELRELARQQPEMTFNQLRTRHATLAARATTFFGSTAAAAEAAELSGWPMRARRPISSREDTLARIRARHARGEPMYRTAVRETDSNLLYSARRHFWSWDDALDAAGVPNDTPYEQWTPQRVIDELCARAERGEGLSTGAMCRRDTRLYNACRRWFGTIGAARRAAGV